MSFNNRNALSFAEGHGIKIPQLWLRDFLLFSHQNIPAMLFFWKTLISFWRDPAYRSLLFATNFFLAIGTVAYRFLEDWSWLDSLYFSVITLTTIGYGDFSPKTDLGKLFTMAYIIIGVSLILGFVNTLFLHYRKESFRKRNNKTKK